MRVLTILGTRPEIIRLSLVIPLLDQAAEHILVHTGQNYDDGLDGVFFREFNMRTPDVRLEIRGATFGEQVAHLLSAVEPVLLQYRPDRILVLGDTNSGLASLAARRLGIPVYHMEAGNRCFDDRVPEEVNRRVIDHCSSVLMPYTERGRANLLREGIPPERIFVTGNPIKQVIDASADRIAESSVLDRLGLDHGRYVLVTIHRQENVDRPDRLTDLMKALELVHRDCGQPVVCSLHPRTRSKLERFGVEIHRAGLRFLAPLGFFDFVRLERSAHCVLSDSGTVQEEACIFGVPNVTVREVTERPETVECGANFLAGTAPEFIARAVRFVTERPTCWTPPPEYLVPLVAETVCRIVTSFHPIDPAEREWAAGPRA